jgi:hypothetical protein
MRSAVTALTWEFWRRHRLGLAGVWAMIAAFCTTCALGLYEFRSGAALHSIWFMMGLAYVIGVFAYGFDGRLEAADTGFPARLLLLPVRTWVLVGWPMLQGMATALLMWVLWDSLVLLPSGIHVPRWWAPMLAAVVAASQALVWRAFPLPWLRLAVAVPVLIALTRIEPLLRFLGVRLSGPETENTTLSFVALAVVAAAYLAAWSGVSRVRHGSETDWYRMLPLPGGLRRAYRTRRGFASPLSAQVWFEWRRRGLGYLLTVTICNLVIMLGGAVFERSLSAAADYATIFVILPIMIACIWGHYMGAGDSVKSMFELTAFTTTRPMTNTGMVAAKLKAAAIAWLVVLVTTTAWLAVTDKFVTSTRLWHHSVENLGRTRTVVVTAVLIAGPALLIWRLLVINLWVGLVGRAWFSVAQLFLSAIILSNVVFGWVWLRLSPERMDRLLDLLPWLAGLAILAKAALGVWLIRVLVRRGQFATATAWRSFAVWAAAALLLIALMGSLTRDGRVPFYGVAFGVVLFLPFTRLALAPLALAWNRHR